MLRSYIPTFSLKPRWTLLLGFAITSGGIKTNSYWALLGYRGCDGINCRPALGIVIGFAIILCLPTIFIGNSLADGIATPPSQSICDMPSQRGTAMYNKYCGSGGSSNSVPTTGGAQPAGPTPLQQMEMQGAQQLGTAIGNQIGDALFGTPQNQAAQEAQEAQEAQQQRTLAAQQLNNSGIYLLKHKNYSGAKNEFQQALAQTPGDLNIKKNLALAEQQIQIKDTALAAKNSATLGKLLGNTPAKSGNNDVDQTTHSPLPNPYSSALNLVNLSSEASTVDLRRAKTTSVDSLKTKLYRVLENNVSIPAPPDPRLQLPEDKDMELLGQPAQSTRPQSVGMQRPANDPKLVNPIQTENQIKAEAGRQFDAIFAQPGGLDDVLEKQATGTNPK